LLGLVFEQEGHPDKALGELQRAIELSDGLIGTGSLGHLYASAGRREEAQRLLQSLDRRANQGYVAPFEYALIHAGLGQADRALEDLRRGYQERSLSAQALKFDPRLGSVRRQAGYREFTKRIGLP
jgi:tetratricopeptide (TPR) repeat protein